MELLTGVEHVAPLISVYSTRFRTTLNDNCERKLNQKYKSLVHDSTGIIVRLFPYAEYYSKYDKSFLSHDLIKC